MATWSKQIVARRTLSAGDLAAIRALGTLCNQADSLNLKLNWDLIQARSPEVVSDFCAHDGDALIGYAALDGDGDELELTGMVRPDHRRRGIARALIAAALEECHRRGTQELLLVSERASASGRAFASVIGGRFSFAEYHMELDATAPSVAPASALQLRLAERDDIPQLADVQARCFAEPREATEALVQRMANRFDDPGSRYYRASVRDELVGQIGVLFEEDQLYIRGVAILPEYRRHGYGRQMLAATVAAMFSEGQRHFSLDVATDNERALGLYQSCGFRETNVYEYYDLPLA
ncbi:MAG: GNAT family N-acetyltransferase [Thermomicrobiales bacterium]